MIYKKFDYFGNGKYEISDEGTVRNSITGKILKTWFNNGGYECVCLTHNSQKKVFLVHRMVAMSHIPIPENLESLGIDNLLINHKDRTPSNNNISNLEWCTYKYNNNYDIHGLLISMANKGKTRSQETKERMSKAQKGLKHPWTSTHNITLKSKSITQYDKDMNLIATFSSATEAARQLGYNQSAISKCCRGEKPHYQGYIWCFKG